MNVIRGKGSKNLLLRPSYLPGFSKMVWHKITHPDKKHLPAYPHIVNFGGHKEAYAVRLGESLEDLRRQLDYAIEKDGDFILTNHVHQQNQKKRENLYALVELARKSDNRVEFVYPSQLFKK